jgi:hypothetical protein
MQLVFLLNLVRIRRTARGAVPFLVACFLAGPCYGQICAGRASFNLSSTHVELDAGTSGGGGSFGAAVGYGTDALFGVAAIARHQLEGDDARAIVIAGTAGTDQPLSPDNRFHVCPMITLGYIRHSTSGAEGGALFGAAAVGEVAMLAVNAPRLRVVPTLGLELRYHGVGRTPAFFGRDGGDGDNTFTAGVGLVGWNRLTVVPRIVIPFGPLDRTGFHVTIGYNVVRK